MNDTSCVFEVIYQTIQQSDNKLSVSRLCQTAGVSRSGYYAWIAAAPLREAREKQDRRDFELILLAYHLLSDLGVKNLSVEINLTAELPPLFSSSWNSGAVYRFDSYNTYSASDYGCPYEWSYVYANEIYYLNVILLCRDVWPNQAERMLTEMIEAAESIMNEFS